MYFMQRSKRKRENQEMRAIDFAREVKAAVSGRWPRAKKQKPRKINKTPEEIWEDVIN